MLLPHVFFAVLEINLEPKCHFSLQLGKGINANGFL